MKVENSKLMSEDLKAKFKLLTPQEQKYFSIMWAK